MACGGREGGRKERWNDGNKWGRGRERERERECGVGRSGEKGREGVGRCGEKGRRWLRGRELLGQWLGVTHLLSLPPWW